MSADVSMQIAPCPIFGNRSRVYDVRSSPKPELKRKPFLSEKHVYEQVPVEPVSCNKPNVLVALPTPLGKLGRAHFEIFKAADKRVDSPVAGKQAEECIPAKPAKPTDEQIRNRKTALQIQQQDESVKVASPQTEKPVPDASSHTPVNQSSLVVDEFNRQANRDVESPPQILDSECENTLQKAKEECLPCCKYKNAPSKSSITLDTVKELGEEMDDAVPISDNSSMSSKDKVMEATTSKSSIQQSDSCSTTCSTAYSSSSGSKKSSSSSYSSYNTSSESTDSTVSKSFFTSPTLGSSTPKQAMSPNNHTPVEFLYDSWVQPSTSKEQNVAAYKCTGKQLNKHCGHYAVTEFKSPSDDPETAPGAGQLFVLPPPMQFSNNTVFAGRESVKYMNLPKTSRTLWTDGISQRNKMIRDSLNLTESKEVLRFRPVRISKSGPYSSPSSPIRHINDYEMPKSLMQASAQIGMEVRTVSCDCQDFLCISMEAEQIASELKQERSMRLVSEQLVKMVEIEVRELKEDLKRIRNELNHEMREKASAQGELREATKIAAQYEVQIVEMEKNLAKANKKISKLEAKLKVFRSPVNDDVGDNDNNSAEHPASDKKTSNKESKTHLEMALLTSKEEVNRLVVHPGKLSKQKSEMLFTTINKEKLRMAEEKANKAEIQAVTLERQLRHLLHRRECTLEDQPGGTGEAPIVPPRITDLKYTGGHTTSPKYIQKHTNNTTSPLTAKKREGALPPRGQPGARSKVKVEQGAKSSEKMSLFRRMQSKILSTQAKPCVEMSLLNRMQSHFFAKSRGDNQASSPNALLPDVSSLQKKPLTLSKSSEYEVPMEPVQRFAGIPLVGVGDTESAEESDWSSEEDGSSSKRHRHVGTHRKARKSPRTGNKPHKERKTKEGAASKHGVTNRDGTATRDCTATTLEDESSNSAARLAGVLSGKDGPMSVAVKQVDNDEVDGKLVQEPGVGRSKVDRNDAMTKIIKIKPPPPKAPKPYKPKRPKISVSPQSSEDDQLREAMRNKGMVNTTHGQTAKTDVFDGITSSAPKLTTFRRTNGPHGRRLPQRYSTQVNSRYSTSSLTAVSA